MSLQVRRGLKRLVYLAAAVAAALLALYAAVAGYFASPFAVRHVSGVLSRHLGHSVTITGLAAVGAGIRISGLRISNPPGYSEDPLLRLEHLVIRPVWPALLTGSLRFTTVEVAGLQLLADRNRAGEWNISRFLESRRNGKRTTEILIRRLQVSDGTVRIQGHRFEHLALTVQDFATTGGKNAGLVLKGTADRIGSFRIEANGRLGVAPSGSVRVQAETDDLATLLQHLQKSLGVPPPLGKARVTLVAVMEKGRVRFDGSVVAEDLQLEAGGGTLATSAEATFAGQYQVDRDEAQLRQVRMVLGKTVVVDATVWCKGIRRGSWNAAADVAVAPLDLEKLWPVIMPRLSQRVAIRGRLSGARVHLEADSSRGITAGNGSIGFKKAAVVHDGITVAGSLSGNFLLKKGTTGWRGDGTVREEAGEASVLDALDMPVTVRLSPRYRLQAVAGPFTASISGIAFAGRANYASFRLRDAWHVALEIPPFAVTRLQRFLTPDVALEGGTVQARVVARGPHIKNLDLSGTCLVAKVTGSLGRQKFSIDSGTAAADGTIGGRTIADGNFTAAGSFAGKPWEVKTEFRASAGVLELRNVSGGFAGGDFRLAGITGTLPHPDGNMTGSITVNSGNIRYGDLFLAGINGRMAPLKQVAGGGPTHTGSLNVADWSYRGTSLGEAEIGIVSANQQRQIRLVAAPLGGRLSGRYLFRSGGAGGVGEFQLSANEIDGRSIGNLMLPGKGWQVAGGRIEAEVSGSHRSASVAAAAEVSGDDVGISDPAGRTVQGLRLHLVADLSNARLLLREAQITSGGGIAVKAEGMVSNPFTGERKGTITAMLRPVPVATVLDDLAPVLPRPLQEAQAAGTVEAVSTLGLDRETAAVDGVFFLRDGFMEVPSQKLLVEGAAGSIPFSVHVRSRVKPEIRAKPSYDRRNYPSLLALLTRDGSGEHSMEIGRIRFGALESMGLRLRLRADNGLTEVTSLAAPFYGGSIHGSASLILSRKPNYAVDLLVNDVSLRALCGVIPPIAGYLAGKVDGVAGFRGFGSGLSDIRGGIDLWSRDAPDEKRLVSKEFLQKLAGKNLKGIFFRRDRPYDRGEVTAFLDDGFLTFTTLDISNTNVLGIRDLNVSVAPAANRISARHLLDTVREAATRTKPAVPGDRPEKPGVETEFTWQE